jgi:hypothetical protein
MRKRILVLLLLGSSVMVHWDALPIHLVWDNFTANATARSIAGLTIPVTSRPFNEPPTDVSIRGYNAEVVLGFDDVLRDRVDEDRGE